MDIKRFGPGFRRPDGPPGTQGVTGQVIYRDDRAVVTEMAFQRFAIVTPHSNQTNTALFIVISGSGFVQVGEERARINHGEAVVWPPDEVHGAYTDGTEMRVLIVELEGEPSTASGRPADTLANADSDPTTEAAAGTTAGTPAPTTPGPTRAEGALAERQITRAEYDSAEGEPW
jgi:quercetin dioxygenase-like cupin family protein